MTKIMQTSIELLKEKGYGIRYSEEKQSVAVLNREGNTIQYFSCRDKFGENLLAEFTKNAANAPSLEEQNQTNSLDKAREMVAAKGYRLDSDEDIGSVMVLHPTRGHIANLGYDPVKAVKFAQTLPAITKDEMVARRYSETKMKERGDSNYPLWPRLDIEEPHDLERAIHSLQEIVALLNEKGYEIFPRGFEFGDTVHVREPGSPVSRSFHTTYDSSSLADFAKAAPEATKHFQPGDNVRMTADAKKSIQTINRTNGSTSTYTAGKVSEVSKDRKDVTFIPRGARNPDTKQTCNSSMLEIDPSVR